jgi:putative Holliday junction resolvase
VTGPAGGGDDPGTGAAPARGVRLGVDVGTVRVGIAACDPDARLAFPVTTLPARDLDSLVLLVHDRAVVEVVVGLPTRLSGEEGPAARSARAFAADLAGRIAPVPVTLVDERLTTVAAHRRMAERGMRGRARRGLVDQEAAVQILQSHLDALARTRRADGP